MITHVIARDYIINDFKKSLDDLRSGKGSIIVLSGESGFGKTHLMNHFQMICDDKDKTINKIYSESQAPIGKFNIGNIRPLFPFSKVLESLINNNHLSAKSKFAKNLGMTVLASLPIVGDVFYAVKEITKDLDAYKKDVTNTATKDFSKLKNDIETMIYKIIEKSPLVILMDDLQWSDSESSELLNLFAQSIHEKPLMFVLGIREQEAEDQLLPIKSFIAKNKGINPNVKFYELDRFTPTDINLLCRKILPNYTHNDEFEEWINNHSYGVPGIVDEYLKYFAQYPPFNPNGDLITDLQNSDFLPSTLQGLFGQNLEKLSDEDRHILSICSSEGREFTVTVAARLLNSDVLATIKKLKSIQSKTGIIKSIGAQNRYGIKTTVYRFAQAFYQSYFENLLEYEEYIALHGEITTFLKERYENTKLEDVRKSIVPYLAAHSMESGDEETAKNMMFESAKIAKEFGANEMIQNAYDSYKLLSGETDENSSSETINQEREFLETLITTMNSNQNSSPSNLTNSDVSNAEDVMNFESVRLAIVNNYHLENYEVAAQKAENYLNNQVDLPTVEEVQLLSLAAKSRIELKEYTKAEDHLNLALSKLNEKSEPQAEHFVLNVLALLHYELGNMHKADDYMKQAAEKSFKLPPELRLVTISNISHIMKHSQPAKAQKFYDAAIKMSKSLDYKRILRDLENNPI